MTQSNGLGVVSFQFMDEMQAIPVIEDAALVEIDCPDGRSIRFKSCVSIRQVMMAKSIQETFRGKALSLVSLASI